MNTRRRHGRRIISDVCHCYDCGFPCWKPEWVMEVPLCVECADKRMAKRRQRAGRQA